MRPLDHHHVRRQATLAGPAMCAGIALHSGERVRLVMRPAPVGTGVVFVRTDVNDRDNVIEAKPQNVTDVSRCTTLANAAGTGIATTEHLMAALAAAGIDNLYVDVDGSELPALDGSSEPFLKLIEQVGIDRQSAPSFRDRLASARTFARLHEVAALQDAGLSKGGSYDNAIVVDGDKVLNPGGLRFNDEFVRHKALDLLGDLYVGGPLLARVTTSKSGHALNHALLTALFADPQAWRFAVLTGPEQATGDDQFVTLPRASILEDVTA